MPTVSICLPVYNGENFLAIAIESALAQTFEDFELLIANDCSTDETQAIIEKYARQDKRIKPWINEKNLKLFGNYNACIQKASGKYIKLFAHDDTFHPTTVERMVAVLEQHPKVNLVTTARCWIDENGERIPPDSEASAKTMRPFEEDVLFAAEEAITTTLREVSNWLGEPSSQMFRKVGADGGYDISFKQVGDLEYSYRLLQHGDYYYIADELCQFRSHPESHSTRRTYDLTAYLDWFLLGSKYSKYLDIAGISHNEYCLNVVRMLTQNLEDRLTEALRTGSKQRCDVLQEFFAGVDPLKSFQCEKNAPRDFETELRALGIIAFVQAAIAENEMRMLHDQLSPPHTPEPLPTESYLRKVRPEFSAGVSEIKRTLDRRHKRVEALKYAVRKGHVNYKSLQETIRGLQEGLAAKDIEIASLRQSLSDVGNSLSWKVTEPLRMLKKR
jgi:glycosyltransferase involved in cell wall biosynthesis